METPWWGRFRWGNRAVYVLDYARGLEGIMGRTRMLEPYTNAAFNLRYDF
jgi:hypothetical protein